jgi:hypothetical protein
LIFKINVIQCSKIRDGAMPKDKIMHDLLMKQAYDNNVNFAADLVMIGIKKDVEEAAKTICSVYNRKDVKRVWKDIMFVLINKNKEKYNEDSIV